MLALDLDIQQLLMIITLLPCASQHLDFLVGQLSASSLFQLAAADDPLFERLLFLGFLDARLEASLHADA